MTGDVGSLLRRGCLYLTQPMRGKIERAHFTLTTDKNNVTQTPKTSEGFPVVPHVVTPIPAPSGLLDEPNPVAA